MYDQLITLRALIVSQLDSDKQLNLDQLKNAFEIRSQAVPQNLEAQIYDVKKSGSDCFIYLTDEAGLVIYHSQNPEFEGENFHIWRNIRLALDNKYGARATRSQADDPTSSVMHVSLPIVHQGKILATISLAKPVKRLSLYLDIARYKIIKTALLTLIFLLLLCFLLTRRIVQPIEDLTAYAAALRDNKRPQSPHVPYGELHILAHTIEEMLKKIDGKAYIESYLQTLSHELKSPLAAVHGALELLEGSDKEQSEKLLANIRRENHRMTEMIEKILFLSRLENRPRKEEFPKLCLNSLIENQLSEMRERFPNYTFNFKAESKDSSIPGDEFLLRVALSNLLTNAVEFSPNGSEIIIKINTENQQLKVSIQDEGSGIPDYALTRLFERFYSLPRPASGRKSSGLGLAIVKEIITLHDGEINIKNRKDQPGTVIEMIF